MGGDFGGPAASPCFPLRPTSPHDTALSQLRQHSPHRRPHHNHQRAPFAGPAGLRRGAAPAAPAACLPQFGAPPLTPAPNAARPLAVPSQTFLASSEESLASRCSANARKRKPSLSEDDDESMSAGRSSASPSAEKPGASSAFGACGFLHGSKRAKFDGHQQLPLKELLGTLDKPQLLNLILSVTEEFPQVRTFVDSHTPRPTLQNVQALLQNLERKLHESFPYTKWGPSRDSYAFNRVKPVILEIKEAVLTFCKHFAGPEEFPTVAFPFLYEATSLTFRLPEWDTPQNNAVKFDLATHLLETYHLTVVGTAAKVSAGKLFGMQVVDGWAHGILSLVRDFPRGEGGVLAGKAAGSGAQAPTPAPEQEREACWRVLLQVARDFADKLGWMCPPQTQQQLLQAAGANPGGGQR